MRLCRLSGTRRVMTPAERLLRDTVAGRAPVEGAGRQATFSIMERYCNVMDRETASDTLFPADLLPEIRVAAEEERRPSR